MAAESAADLAGMLLTDDFSVTATYTLAAGGVSTFNVIFDNEFIETDVQAGVEIATQNPHCICQTIDLPATAAPGDGIVISSISYTVGPPPLPDGTGITTIMLEKV